MSWLWGGSKKKTKDDHDDDNDDDSSYEDEEYSDEEDDDEAEYSDDDGDDEQDKPHRKRHEQPDGKDDLPSSRNAPPTDDANKPKEEQRDPASSVNEDDDKNDILPAAVAEKTNEKNDNNHNNKSAAPTNGDSHESDVDDHPVESAAAATGEDTTEQQRQSSRKSSKKVAQKYNSRSDDDDNDDDEDLVVTDEDVLVGIIPPNVTSNRPRFPSALSDGGDDDDDDDDNYHDDNEETSVEKDHENEKKTKSNSNYKNARVSSNAAEENNDNDDFETVDIVESDNSKDEGEDDEEEEEETMTTSIAEKQSLLVLAAEHDRVDILQALLNEAVVVPAATTPKNGEMADDTNINNIIHRTPQEEQRHVLLHGGIPPLHIAIKHGSVNATNCLLRMGADPSIRPNARAVSSLSSQNNNNNQPPALAVPKDLDGVSAWELAFGQRPVTMPPSKREGIRHAFLAEALRCIGSDEAPRLQQLLDAGMPVEIEMGGKTLYDWAVDMQGVQCQKALRPQQQQQQQQQQQSESSSTQNDANNVSGQTKTTAVLDRPSGKETFAQLVNRFDELENLARALSTCLDNLAEEVSVCHGLLLMGGGATALASHVRSLKALQERKLEELTRLEETWENSEDELAYWVRECGGPEGAEIAAQITPADMHLLVRRQSLLQSKQQNDNHDPAAPPVSAEEKETSRLRQLQAQIAASESKVRKLRVSIADLSEENARDLAEVEKRGLTGGIHLVRGLREEIREVEFSIAEVKSAEAGCRAKISMIQTKVQQKQQQQSKSTTNNSKTTPSSSSPTGQTKSTAVNGINPPCAPSLGTTDDALVNGSSDTSSKPNEAAGVVKEAAAGCSGSQHAVRTMTHSERMATGQSTAIALRTNVVSGRGGYFTIGLWQIIMRIIGIGGGGGGVTAASGVPVSSSSSSAVAPPPRSGNNRSYSRSSSTGTAQSSAQPAMIV
jgi:hypothetical protein